MGDFESWVDVGAVGNNIPSKLQSNVSENGT